MGRAGSRRRQGLPGGNPARAAPHVRQPADRPRPRPCVRSRSTRPRKPRDHATGLRASLPGGAAGAERAGSAAGRVWRLPRELDVPAAGIEGGGRVVPDLVGVAPGVDAGRARRARYRARERSSSPTSTRGRLDRVRCGRTPQPLGRRRGPPLPGSGPGIGVTHAPSLRAQRPAPRRATSGRGCRLLVLRASVQTTYSGLPSVY